MNITEETQHHSDSTDQKTGSQTVDVPLIHVLGRPDPPQAGVEPSEVIQADSVQETSQSFHVKGLGHLPETDEDCLRFKLGKPGFLKTILSIISNFVTASPVSSHSEQKPK